MNKHACCFTGHRNIPENQYVPIQKCLEEEVIKLIHQGVQRFYAGGALGFDTMAALTVLKAKESFPYIRLILVLPCKNQSVKWNEKDKKIYNQIREQSDEVVYTAETYTRGWMHVRNRYLVDNSGFCLCYLTETTGGTKYTFDYAKQKGLTVVNRPYTLSIRHETVYLGLSRVSSRVIAASISGWGMAQT